MGTSLKPVIMTRTYRILIAAVFAVWVGLTAYGVYQTGLERDVVREWVVAKYVIAGRDPFSLARDVLTAEFGVGNPGNARVSRIPEHAPEARRGDVLPEYGTPEATYPPPAIGLIAGGLGFLDDPAAVVQAWFVLNVVMTLWLALGLSRMWRTPPAPLQRGGNFWWILLLVVLFTPTYANLERGPFSLLVIGMILVVEDPSIGWALRGAALGVALLKPSVTLPFLFLPLVRREWRVLATAVVVQALASGYVMIQTGKHLSLFLDWLAVSKYFLAPGMYTIQEWLHRLSAAAPWLSPVVSLSILAACAASLEANKHLPRAWLFSLTGVTAMFWTYHGTYDSIFLLPMLLRRIGWSNQESARPWSIAGVVLFTALSIGLMDRVVGSHDPIWHAYRWIIRLTMIGVFVKEYVDLYREGRRVKAEALALEFANPQRSRADDQPAPITPPDHFRD